jgi:hypothetical protein
MLSSIKEFLKWKIFKILAEQFLLFNFAFAQRRALRIRSTFISLLDMFILFNFYGPTSIFMTKPWRDIYISEAGNMNFNN